MIPLSSSSINNNFNMDTNRNEIKNSNGNSIFSSILQSYHVGNMKILIKLNEKLRIDDPTEEDYAKLRTKKTRLQLIIISLIVCGIEFCYAAETAFVSPILLKIGVPVQYMTMVWCLSPLFGFITCPILGFLSDNCKSKLGRRRPFIILYSCGIITGLIFVSHGENIGLMLDKLFHLDIIKPTKQRVLHPFVIFITVLGVFLLDFDCDACQSPSRAYLIDICIKEDHSIGLSTFTVMAGVGGFFGYIIAGIPWEELLFVNKRFKSTKLNYTNLNVYGNNTINDVYNDEEDRLESKHIQIIFTFVLVIYIIFATFTLTSYKEINPNNTDTTKTTTTVTTTSTANNNFNDNIGKIINRNNNAYENLDEEFSDIDECHINRNQNRIIINENTRQHSFENDNCKKNIAPIQYLRQYFLSIFKIQKYLLLLCLTNCFCWMALVCYSLYFTDFVAQEIFGGNPNPLNSLSYSLYEKGVRYGSICMAFYSLSCSIYSYLLDYLINRYQTKYVYMSSQLIYSASMLILALTKTKVSALLISPFAGILYSTLFTIPYMLVAKYHHYELVNENTELINDYSDSESNNNKETLKRGLGSDISLVGSMVFVAQFILSLFMGTLIKIIGTNTVIAYSASIFSLCGAITANFLLYLE